MIKILNFAIMINVEAVLIIQQSPTLELALTTVFGIRIEPLLIYVLVLT